MSTHQTSTVRSQTPGDIDNWQQYAACGGDLDSFYSDKGDSHPGEDPRPWEQDALRICARCPVRQRCLDEALLWPENAQHGVQGGMTATQRRELIHARNQQPTKVYDTDVVDISDLPPGVDYRTVQALALGQKAPGAGAQERRWAAMALHRGGWTYADIALHLGAAKATVCGWLTEIRKQQTGAAA